MHPRPINIQPTDPARLRSRPSTPGRRAKIRRTLLAVTLLSALLGSACSSQAETTSRGFDVTTSAVNDGSNSDATSSPADESTQSTEPQSSGADQSTDPTSGSEGTAETAASEQAIGDPAFFDTAVFATDLHPGGSQVFVDEIQLTSGVSTIVRGRVFNGRDFATTYLFDDDATTALIDASGARFGLRTGQKLERIPHGESVPFVLEFEPVDERELIGFELNFRVDDELSPNENRPGFRIEPRVNITAPEPAPALPAGLPISEIAVHPNNLTLQVAGVGFTDSHIGVGISAINGTRRRFNISSGHHASYLEDDLGNRYWLKFDGDGRQIYVDDRTDVGGVLVFGGRVHPNASTLTMVLNADESETDPSELVPKFVLGPWPIDGSWSPADQIAPLIVNDLVVHQNGAQFTLNGIEFGEAAAIVDLTVINPDARQFFVNGCCSGTYLLDDLGNRYLLQSPADDQYITVPRGEGVEGQFAVPGKVPEEATSISLVIGDHGRPDARTANTGWPELEFGPYLLSRQPGSADTSTPPSGFGARTLVTAEAVQQSDASDVALVFSEFSGIEIPGGVRLTLPEGILFDSGQSQLRGDARESIDKVIQILEFYSGDPVTVIGHTDSEGSDEFNQGLSLDRAQAVQASLITQGATASLLSTEGRGESDPIADNATEAGRAQNRRVEIEILTDKGLPQ